MICALLCIEPCTAPSVGHNSSSKKLEKTKQFRKCLHYYLYCEDKDFWFIHILFQTWFPFGVQIYINGKGYLKKQLRREGINFKGYDNSITWVSDIERAQQISSRFYEKKWDKVFDNFAERVNFGRKLHGLCQGGTVPDKKYSCDQWFRIKFTLDKNSLKCMTRQVSCV